jgi:hypothetical protein
MGDSKKSDNTISIHMSFGISKCNYSELLAVKILPAKNISSS